MKEIIVANLKADEIPFNGPLPSTVSDLGKEFLVSLALMMNSNEIDGTKVSDSLFKVQPVDIFISYSHNDLICAKKLACFLSQFNVSVFLDCELWNSSDEFLKNLDKEYAYRKETNDYDYNIRNRTTAHAHAMLSSALMSQISKSEYMIVLNPRSNLLNKEDVIKKTDSPWIYEEVLFAKTIIECAKNHQLIEHSQFEDSEPVPINYKLPLSDCKIIDSSNIDSLEFFHLKSVLFKNVDELIVKLKTKN